MWKQPIVGCLICCKNITSAETSLNSANITEILSNLFEVLGVHMKWANPSTHKFDFTADPFPFCKDCKLSVVTLFKLHEQLESIQKKLNEVTIGITEKILQSKNVRKSKERVSYSEENAARRGSLSKIFRKCNYYRNLTFNQFSPILQLPRDSKLDTLETESPGNRQPKDHSVSETENYEERDSTTSNSDDTTSPPPTGETGEAIEVLDVSRSVHQEITYLGLIQKESQSQVEPKKAFLPFLSTSKYNLGRRNANSSWRCTGCDEDFPTLLPLLRHQNSCPGSPPPPDAIETFKIKGHTYDIFRNGKFQCRHCKLNFFPYLYLTSSSKQEIMEHLGSFHSCQSQPGSR